MAGPTPSWSTVTVYGTWMTQKGVPVRGKIRFSVSQRVISVTDDVIFPAGTTWDEPIDNENGSISIDLPCVDDPDNIPELWSIKVQELFEPGYGDGETYFIQPIMAMVNTGLDLRGVFPLEDPAEAINPLIGVSNGLARLDADGDVVDSAGIKVRLEEWAGVLRLVDGNLSSRPFIPSGSVMVIDGPRPDWMEPGDLRLTP